MLHFVKLHPFAQNSGSIFTGITTWGDMKSLSQYCMMPDIFFLCSLCLILKWAICQWQTYTFLEEAIGDSAACQAARAAASKATGSKVSDIVLNGLPSKVKKQGLKGAIYQKEQDLFNDVADRTFRTLGVSKVIGCVKDVTLSDVTLGSHLQIGRSGFGKGRGKGML